jgi:hypothetical protein
MEIGFILQNHKNSIKVFLFRRKAAYNLYLTYGNSCLINI